MAQSQPRRVAAEPQRETVSQTRLVPAPRANARMVAQRRLAEAVEASPRQAAQREAMAQMFGRAPTAR